MKKYFVSLLSFLLLLTPVVYASSTTEELEPLIQEKKWNEVYEIINKVPDIESETLKYNVTHIRSFLDDYYKCTDQENKLSLPLRKILDCYDRAIRVSWDKMPKKLPFSKKFVDDLNNKKNYVNQRRALLSEEIRQKNNEEIKQRREKEKEQKRAEEEALKIKKEEEQ